MAPHYTARMKAILVLLLGLLSTLVLSGCETDLPTDARTQADPGTKLQRGLTGQGTLVQPTRENDPFVQSETRVGQ
jgi:hypothetical protein